jgi:hypothetical protein
LCSVLTIHTGADDLNWGAGLSDGPRGPHPQLDSLAFSNFTIKLWRLKEDGRKLFAGTIEAATPAELVIKWSAFVAMSERGAYFATYWGSFLGPEPARESDAGALAA